MRSLSHAARAGVAATVAIAMLSVAPIVARSEHDRVSANASRATRVTFTSTPKPSAPIRERTTKVSRAKPARRAVVVKRTESRYGFKWPIPNKVTSRYGSRWRGWHSGIDIRCVTGQKVRAARSGRVVFAGVMPIYGRAVIVQHGTEYRTLYAHLSRVLVRKGWRVDETKVIGLCGSTGRSTGPHLHFELYKDWKPKNPAKFLRRACAKVNGRTRQCYGPGS